MLNATILIVSPNWLGDAVMAMPAVKRFRINNPDVIIVMLAKPSVAPLWRMHDSVDEILELGGGNAATFAMTHQLRSRKIAQAFILPNSFRSALIPFLACVPKRRGTAFHARSLMVNDPVSFKTEKASGKLHQSLEYMKILCGEAHGDLFETGFHPPKPALLQELKLSPTDIPVCIIPGAARGESKRWPFFAEAAKQILTKAPAARFIVTGAKGEADLCQRVTDVIGDRAVSVAGRTGLSEFAALLGNCRLVICNDSGGMHLASAAGVPVVTVYGLTDPETTGPIGANATIIRAEGVKASRDVPRQSAAAVAALSSISAQRVASACLEKLMVS